MDANKVKTLREIEYSLGGTCDSCIYANIPKGQVFGTCEAVSYKHGKHSQEARHLSISRMGGCPSWEGSPEFFSLHSHFVF